MAHAQKPNFVFPRNGRVHLSRWGRQFSRLLAAEVCASARVMLDRPRSEVAWEYWLPTPFASFHFTSPPVGHRVPPGSERALLKSVIPPFVKEILIRETQLFAVSVYPLGYLFGQWKWFWRPEFHKRNISINVNYCAGQVFKPTVRQRDGIWKCIVQYCQEFIQHIAQVSLSIELANPSLLLIDGQHLLNPCSRALLDKLRDFQLVQKFLAF